MRASLFLLFMVHAVPSFARVEAPLGAYNIAPNSVTISGVSSGAFMAVQMQVAFSKTISGAASVAGGTYWCAKGSADRGQSACMGEPDKIISAEQVAEAQRLAGIGAIDPLANLARVPVYVYASPVDSIINPGNSDKLLQFLKVFIDKTQIHFVNSVVSAHGFPTLNSGNACEFAMPPWILNCNHDAAGEILRTMYGPLLPRGHADATHLLKFSQSDFGNDQTPLYKNGWIYVPQSCASGDLCKLHVALHGCLMNPEYIQDQFEKLTGYNEWAEANKIIVLYPQSATIDKLNPYGCWDWFGFTGKNYVTQTGTQMVALKKMIDRVRGL